MLAHMFEIPWVLLITHLVNIFKDRMWGYRQSKVRLLPSIVPTNFDAMLNQGAFAAWDFSRQVGLTEPLVLAITGMHSVLYLFMLI